MEKNASKSPTTCFSYSNPIESEDLVDDVNIDYASTHKTNKAEEEY